MREVRNDQSMGVRPLALYSHAVSTNSVGIESRSCVDTHVDLVILGTEETKLLGLLLIDIIDVAISNVVSLVPSSFGYITYELGLQSMTG